jgi:hypothetical protein
MFGVTLAAEWAGWQEGVRKKKMGRIAPHFKPHSKTV